MPPLRLVTVLSTGTHFLGRGTGGAGEAETRLKNSSMEMGMAPEREGKIIGAWVVTWHTVPQVGKDGLGAAREHVGGRVDERVAPMPNLFDAPQSPHLDRQGRDAVRVEQQVLQVGQLHTSPAQRAKSDAGRCEASAAKCSHLADLLREGSEHVEREIEVTKIVQVHTHDGREAFHRIVVQV